MHPCRSEDALTRSRRCRDASPVSSVSVRLAIWITWRHYIWLPESAVDLEQELSSWSRWMMLVISSWITRFIHQFSYAAYHTGIINFCCIRVFLLICSPQHLKLFICFNNFDNLLGLLLQMIRSSLVTSCCKSIFQHSLIDFIFVCIEQHPYIVKIPHSTVLDEPEREAGTTSIPIPQREESENIPSPDLPEQLENVQQSGNEIAERGMQT